MQNRKNKIKLIINAFINNPFAPEATKEVTKQSRVLNTLGDEGQTNFFTYLCNERDFENIYKLILALGVYRIRKGKNIESFKPSDFLRPETHDTVINEEKLKTIDKILKAYKRTHIAFDKILGGSDKLNEAKQITWHACFGKSLYHTLNVGSLLRNTHVCIRGDSGTGKELFAQVIQEAHLNYDKNKTLSINVAAIPDELVDGELFGWVKGAFTNAANDHVGIIRNANNYTLLLDEIGDMAKNTQAKVLRAIEENKVRKIGATSEEEANVRYICATNKNLENEDAFRQDLFYRISGIEINLPSLKDRKKDVIEIGEAFIQSKMDSEGGIEDYNIDEYNMFLKKLIKLNSDWAGNVRTLHKLLTRHILGLATDELLLKLDLNHQNVFNNCSEDPHYKKVLKGMSLHECKKWYISYIYNKNNFKKTKTAMDLDISRATVHKYITS